MNRCHPLLHYLILVFHYVSNTQIAVTWKNPCVILGDFSMLQYIYFNCANFILKQSYFYFWFNFSSNSFNQLEVEARHWADFILNYEKQTRNANGPAHFWHPYSNFPWHKLSTILFSTNKMVLVGLIIFLVVAAFMGIIFLIWFWKRQQAGLPIFDVTDSVSPGIYESFINDVTQILNFSDPSPLSCFLCTWVTKS